jgi:hypothetical protein
MNAVSINNTTISAATLIPAMTTTTAAIDTRSSIRLDITDLLFYLESLVSRKFRLNQ